MTTEAIAHGLTMQIVPFDEAHIPIFAEWFNALPDNGVWTEQAIRERTVSDQAYDPQLMFAVTKSGHPVGFLLGNIANDVGWIRAFLVRPDFQRQGVGTLMFEIAEQVFSQRGIAEINAGWALPRYFLPGIDIRYTPAIVFLDQRGYQTNRETRVNLRVPLDRREFGTATEEAKLARHGITIRRAHQGDSNGITRLCEEHNSLGWAVETAIALQRHPVTVFVAEHSADICAFATHSVCGPVHFGPMLTAAERRGLGVGTVLLKRCLLDWQQAGVHECEIVWAGPISFYARAVGASISKAFWTFHKSLC